jgi:hypothetical protein
VFSVKIYTRYVHALSSSLKRPRASKFELCSAVDF